MRLQAAHRGAHARRQQRRQAQRAEAEERQWRKQEILESGDRAAIRALFLEEQAEAAAASADAEELQMMVTIAYVRTCRRGHVASCTAWSRCRLAPAPESTTARTLQRVAD